MKSAEEFAKRLSLTESEDECIELIEARDSDHAVFAAEACKVVAGEWKAIHDKAVSEHAAALAKAEERCRGLEEALEKIKGCGPIPTHQTDEGLRTRCLSCQYAWDGDEPEEHGPDCPYVIARAALEGE